MKHVLFIAPHSYPVKSSESICNSKVAYTLAQGGYKVDVFACKDAQIYPTSTNIDQILSSSPNLNVYYIEGSHAISRNLPLYKLVYNILYNFLILFKTGYYYSGIWRSYDILKRVKRQIREYGKMPYDVVITRGFNTDLVGIYMSKKYGIKWIANWNDPYPKAKFPAPYGEGPDTKLPFFQNKMYESMQDFISIYTFPNERLRNYMLNCFKKMRIEQTMVIPHMAHTELSVGRYNKNNVLRLVHCGDIRKPRNPELFLLSLSKVLNSLDEEISMECCFIGLYENETLELVKNDSKLNSCVKFLGSKSYFESIGILSESTISLIIEADCEEGIYLPTKFVDALQCELPVFCVSPMPGMLNDLVLKYNVGYSCHNVDQEDIIQNLHKLISDFKNDNLPLVFQKVIPSHFEHAILEQYKSII